MNLKIKCGASVIVDPGDYEELHKYPWEQATTGFVVASIRHSDGRPLTVIMNRLITGAVSGQKVVHLNGDRLDHRRANLRAFEYRPYKVKINGVNKNNRTGVRGVQYYKDFCPTKPWRAQITAEGQNYHLGMFATMEEAVAARHAAELCFFGQEFG